MILDINTEYAWCIVWRKYVVGSAPSRRALPSRCRLCVEGSEPSIHLHEHFTFQNYILLIYLYVLAFLGFRTSNGKRNLMNKFVCLLKRFFSKDRMEISSYKSTSQFHAPTRYKGSKKTKLLVCISFCRISYEAHRVI